MSLASQLTAAFAAVAVDMKRVRTYITGSSTGDLSSLTTTSKTSIISAINEVKASGGASGTKTSALTAATALDGTEDVMVVQGGVSKRADVSLFDVAQRAVCASDSTNSTVTPAAVTDLSMTLTPGTYNVKVWMLLQSANVGTGIGVHLNASGGTVTKIAATWYSLTTGTTATTGVMDQASAAATFQTMEGRAQRANNTSGGAFGGVDTANADQFAVLEGIVIVTATTTLQTMLASEVAASAVKMLTGSNIRVVKVA